MKVPCQGVQRSCASVCVQGNTSSSSETKRLLVGRRAGLLTGRGTAMPEQYYEEKKEEVERVTSRVGRSIFVKCKPPKTHREVRVLAYGWKEKRFCR